jgi:hypothetical protein
MKKGIDLSFSKLLSDIWLNMIKSPGIYAFRHKMADS